VGTKSNRAAIGARVKIVTETSQGPQVIHRVVGTGGSFGGNPLRQEIGLSGASSVSSIEIFWPVTGQTQKFKNLAADRFYRIVEGKDQLEELKMKTFEFRNPNGGHQHHHSQ
jgi:hypothetical protein